jgi:mannose-6-phosphate isomerase-like protein (cupin superfamily)
VVAISAVRNGTALSRTDQPDEYMLLTDYSVAATCRAGADRIEAGTASVTIIPPGDSEIVCRGEGYVVRCFTTRAEDIAGVALNRENYAEGAPECLLLQNWPDPVGGFKLRNYDLAAMSRVTFAHIIRATNLMLSTPLRGLTRRAPNALSPHHHDNFEQISIILEGRWIHHVRMPWTSDSTRWRNDEHLQYDAPSALVIPASVIHTSQDVGQGPCWLIDLFSPPREDFSRQPGWVLNAADYPAPWEVA